MPRGRCNELFTPAVKERIGGDQKGAGAQLRARCEDRFEVVLAAGMDDMELEPEHACRLSHLVCLRTRGWLAWIDHRNDHGCAWN